MKFSETLIDLRKEKNLSQQQLANATGLSRSAIAESEKGRKEATASTLLRLSRFFKVSVDEMLSETELPHLQSLVDATFPGAESELIESFRKFSENGKARAAAYVDFLVRQESDRKNRCRRFRKKAVLSSNRILCFPDGETVAENDFCQYLKPSPSGERCRRTATDEGRKAFSI